MKCCSLMVAVLLGLALPVRAGGRGDWFSPGSSVSNTVLALEAPTLLGPIDGTIFALNDEIILSWTQVEDATGYVYELNGNGALAFEEQVNLPLNPYALGTFDWRVRALGNNESSPWSETWTFYREDGVTPTPTPEPVPTPLPDLDINGDGGVDHLDSFTFLSQWQQEDAPGDLTGEGFLDQDDLLLYLKGWKAPGRQFPTPVALLPGPDLLEPNDGETIDFWEIIFEDVPPGQPPLDKGVWFRWSAVDGADWYQLRVQGPDGWSNLGDYIESDINGTELKVTLPLRTDNSKDLGLYQWRVRGYSISLGGMGAYSDPLTFSVEILRPTPLPTATPIPRTGDLDQDGTITLDELFTYALAWQVSEASHPQQYAAFERADLNLNGQIDASDLHRFVGNYRRRIEETMQAPVLLVPADGTEVPLGDIVGPNAGTFEWKFQASPNAAVYEYEIRGPAPFARNDYLHDTGSAEYDLFDEVTPYTPGGGQWYWRVRAFGPTGRPSPWSPEWYFQVYSSISQKVMSD